MLRITIQPSSNGTTLKLEGKVSGPWVQDLERFWQRVRENALHRPVRVDMTSVLLVDWDGSRVLKGMQEDGAELMGEDSFIKSMIDNGDEWERSIEKKRTGSG